jgi:mercuric ion transport protein
METPTSKLSMTAGVLAAIGASVCCVGPLVLLGLGVSGAWIANLTALEPLRPILIGVTLVFLALAYRRLYGVAQVCAPGTACADTTVLQRQRTTFWIVSVLVLALLAFPWIAPAFL